MRSFLFYLLTLSFVSIASCQRRSTYQQNSKTLPGRTGYPYGGYGNADAMPEPTSASKLQQNKSSSGIGAWGYVAILLTVILSGMGAYYFVIFYPIVCKKERMYDVMEMTTV